jgi:hypothetical protein
MALQHHQRKARPVFRRAAKFVGAQIAGGVEELVDQIAAGAMQFHAINPCRTGVARSLRIFLRQAGSSAASSARGAGGHRHAVRPRHLVRAGQGGGRDNLCVKTPIGGHNHAPAVHQLHDDLPAFGMDRVGHLGPARHLFRRMDARRAPIALADQRGLRAFCHDQPGAGALAVIFHHQRRSAHRPARPGPASSET